VQRALAFLVLVAGCDKLLGLQPPTVPPAPDAPPDAIPPGNWSAVAAGLRHTCAIEQGDGSLWCWGGNDFGVLGQAPTTFENDTPARIDGSKWIALSSAGTATCGIRDDHSLWCWGEDSNFQLGPSGTSIPPGMQVQIPGSWASISIHVDHACGLQMDQSLWCWGGNSHGQLGNGVTGGSYPTPAQIQGAWTMVSAGDEYTCGVQTDGSGWCWGLGVFSQLGNGLATSRVMPTLIAGGGTYRAIAAGTFSTCGLRTDGTIRCWGGNSHGQVGDLTTSDRAVPVAIGDDSTDWASITVGLLHACATRNDGSLWCWGDNSHGQLATPRQLALSSGPLAVDVPHVMFTAVSAGDFHTCALSSDGNLWCAGADARGQLADMPTHRVPVEVPGAPWSSPVAGKHDTCALDSQGLLECWGENGSSQLGDATTTPRMQPQKVDDAKSPTSVTLGDGSVCELRGGARWCWGDNQVSAFGDGGNTSSPLPEAIATSPAQWQRIKTSPGSSVEPLGDHSCGLDPSGTLYCWGDNAIHDSNPGINMPLLLAPSMVQTNVSDFDVGPGYTCMILSNILECWGRDDYGQVGNGNQPDQLTMVQINPLVTPVSLALGTIDACVLDATGTASCWGANLYGETGRGATGQAVTPAVIVNHTWRAIAVGESHACGIAMDRTLWCWGTDQDGQLGDGQQVQQTSPQQVGTDADWDAIASGLLHSCATKTDGRLFCWGDDSQGELGTGRAWRPTLAIVPAP
jgi:alpha-tubulin suppressor-like RCC1 family protein